MLVRDFVAPTRDRLEARKRALQARLDAARAASRKAYLDEHLTSESPRMTEWIFGK
jgi:hypothetical protein